MQKCAVLFAHSKQNSSEIECETMDPRPLAPVSTGDVAEAPLNEIML